MVTSRLAGVDRGNAGCEDNRSNGISEYPCCSDSEARHGVTMQVAKPEELTSYALPVLTAQVSDAEMAEWFPVPFEQIENPEATPEPSMGALLRLSNGELFVVYFGRVSKQLTLRLPPTGDESAFVESFLREVPLPLSRVTWHRPDVALPSRHEVARAANH